MPNSITSIESNTFSYCTGLENITIPTSVTTIGKHAFFNCTSLKSIEIPSSVTSIGVCALNNCANLSSITVSSSNEAYDSRENCNAIIETASNALIAGCQNSTIPVSVTAIGDYAYGGCLGLTTIDIPSTIASMGEGAFYGCTNLTNIDIPKTITSIESSTFSGCSSLKDITIPRSVTAIGDFAFYDCTNLIDVYSFIIDPFEVSMGYYVFNVDGDNYSNRKLHVPSEALQSYQVHESWVPYFGSIVEMVPDQPGDVNGDNEVNINDINSVVNTILDGNYSSDADVDGDGEVRVSDINSIINFILDN